MTINNLITTDYRPSLCRLHLALKDQRPLKPVWGKELLQKCFFPSHLQWAMAENINILYMPVRCNSKQCFALRLITDAQQIGWKNADETPSPVLWSCFTVPAPSYWLLTRTPHLSDQMKSFCWPQPAWAALLVSEAEVSKPEGAPLNRNENTVHSLIISSGSCLSKPLESFTSGQFLLSAKEQSC